MFNTNAFPAIFTPSKSPERSEKYQFVNTSEVVQALTDKGFNIRQATQRGKGPSAKHMVRLTHSDIEVGNGNRLEVVLRNSHNGTSSLNLHFGVFRFVCSNGLVVGDDMINPLRLRHSGKGIPGAIETALVQIDEQRQLVAEQILLMQQTEMSNETVRVLGYQALELAFPEEFERHTDTNLKLITTPRRSEDKGNSTWQVYNTIQENIIRGGQLLEGMTRTLRPIRELDRDLKINKGLWNLSVNSAKAA